MKKERMDYKLFSQLLQYPEEEWVKNKDWEKVLSILDKPIKNRLANFQDYLKNNPVHQIAENYVQTFDFSNTSTLHITYYQYKDQQERGQALLALKEAYTKAGLYLDSRELPDFLPVLLEFASVVREEEAEALLLEQLPNIEKLSESLVQMNSPYQHVISAVMETIQSRAEQELTGGVI